MSSAMLSRFLLLLSSLRVGHGFIHSHQPRCLSPHRASGSSGFVDAEILDGGEDSEATAGVTATRILGPVGPFSPFKSTFCSSDIGFVHRSAALISSVLRGRVQSLDGARRRDGILLRPAAIGRCRFECGLTFRYMARPSVTWSS